jgi:uroporphyrinogen III methyltransferase/synthase
MPGNVTSGKGSGRTIVLSPRQSGIELALRRDEFSVMTWPELSIQPPPNYVALDDAIENLFGYDWLVFVKEHAAHFFLERFTKQGHDVSELDSLHVCAIGEATAGPLERSQVHVDVITTNVTAPSVVEQIANYVGAREALQRLNVLIPQAPIGRAYLKPELEAVDARADVVIAYETVMASDRTRLAVLETLLLTGSVDAVVFASESDVSDCARLFDTNDLGRLLRNATVFSCDRRAAMLVARMGVAPTLISESSSEHEMISALMKRSSPK